MYVKINATKFDDIIKIVSNLFTQLMQGLQSTIDIFAFSERLYVYSSISSLRYLISRIDLKAMNEEDLSLCFE